MAGIYLIDHNTFTTMIFMASAPREKFGESGVQEVNGAGVKKWSVDVAVTFPPVAAGMKASSEVMSVTLAADHDPAQGIPQGTLVLFHGLRLGISAPEKRDNGRVAGGKPYFMADAIRPAASRSEGKAA